MFLEVLDDPVSYFEILLHPIFTFFVVKEVFDYPLEFQLFNSCVKHALIDHSKARCYVFHFIEAPNISIDDILDELLRVLFTGLR